MSACRNWNHNEVHTFYGGSCEGGWMDGREVDTQNYAQASYYCLMVNSETTPLVPPTSLFQ